jgi:hypothetical protein
LIAYGDSALSNNSSEEQTMNGLLQLLKEFYEKHKNVGGGQVFLGKNINSFNKFINKGARILQNSCFQN